MKAFITGSRAYGVPTKDSDVDIVIRAETPVLLFLYDYDDVNQNNHHVSADCSVRFGRLNMIVATSDREYEEWAEAKRRCMAERPVTKIRAIEIHDQVREEFRKKGEPTE